jgi:hypothetical protein
MEGKLWCDLVQTWPRQTLLVKSQWLISNALRVRITRGMYAISSPFKRSMQGRFSARFGLTQQSHS